jgi:hypothetical protein
MHQAKALVGQLVTGNACPAGLIFCVACMLIAEV